MLGGTKKLTLWVKCARLHKMNKSRFEMLIKYEKVIIKGEKELFA